MPVVGGNAINHKAAYAGMVADLQLCNTVSKLNKSTTVTIPWAYGVMSDGDDGARLPAAGDTTAKFVGVVRRVLNRAYPDGAVLGAVPQYDFDVVTSGVIWVTARVAVAKDDPVFVVIGDGTGANQGQFSNVAGSAATTAVAVSDAKWVSSAGAGQLAKISLNIGG